MSPKTKSAGNIRDIYPLSPMQEGMFFHWLYDPSSPAYFEQASYRLEGDLDAAIIQQSLNRLSERHDVLRTAFIQKGANPPLQVVLKERKIDFHYEDLSHREKNQKEAYILRYKEQDRKTPFNLEQDVLMRVAVIKLDSGEYEFIWSHHHILMDGWCVGIIIAEFLEIYRGILENIPVLLPRTIPYRTYIRWLEKQDREKSRFFWKNYLESYRQLAAIPRLNAVHRNHKTETPQKEKYTLGIQKELTASLKHLCARNRVTLNTFIQTVWGIILAAYAGRMDVVFGAVVSGRPPEIPGVDQMIGLFINTIPVRVKYSPDTPFRELIKTLQQEALQSEPHHYYPLVEIQSQCALKQNLLDHILVFENFPEQQIERAGKIRENKDKQPVTRISQVESFEQTTYDFALLAAVNVKLFVHFHYNAHLFAREFIEAIAHQFHLVLQQAVSHETVQIGNLTLLSGKDREQILYGFNRTRLEYPGGPALQLLFEREAEKKPHAISVIYEDGHLTFKELNRNVNQLARLLRKKGVKPDVIVGIMVERSLEMVLGSLAVLKAGGTYLPIDPHSPAKRLNYMLLDSRAPLLLTKTHKPAGETLKIQTAMGIEILDPGDRKPLQDPDDRDGTNLEPLHHPNHLVHVIYTSGSTGKPKGVMIEHRSVVNFIYDLHENLYGKFGPRLHLALIAPYMFAGSVKQVFTSLLFGHCLAIVPEPARFDGNLLLDFFITRAIDITDATPAHLMILLSALASRKEKRCPVKHFNVSADVLTRKLVEEFWAAFHVPKPHIANLYGPTECCVDATGYSLEADALERLDTIPIGTPLANANIYILDPTMNPNPVGVTGELYISGEGVARGYLNNPGLTREKFLPNPFVKVNSKGKTLSMYKTGDQGRWLPGGHIEFLGRIDRQVKIRGHRVELAEIENTLNRHEDMENCSVIPRTIDDEQQLIAYIKKKKKILLKPSWAEQFVYDDMAYYAMTSDQDRNEKYRQVFNRVLKDKVVLEIGPGPDLVLSRLCLEAGAKKIYSVEIVEESYKKAKQKIKTLGWEDQITLIHGDVTRVHLPGKADYCISEIVGSIGGSQGAAKIINAVRRLLKDPTCMIPARSLSRIAAITLPAGSLDWGFDEVGAHYVDKIFKKVGCKFDLRLCLENFPPQQIISSTAVFEDLDYTRENDLESEHDICLEILDDSILSGFIVWLRLYIDADTVIDTLEEGKLWLPLYLPIFSRGVRVKKRDVIKAKITRKLSPNRLNPDFIITGTLSLKDSPAIEFHYDWFNEAPIFRNNDFYQRLFPNGEIRVKEKLTAGLLREFLGNDLPGYMIPSSFIELEEFPLTPGGKIDRNALASQEGSLISRGARYVAPADEVEEKLVEIWSQVLGIKKELIGIDTSFFELGGHSLKATMMVSMVHKELAIKVPLAQVFKKPSIRELAKWARSTAPDQFVSIKPVEKKEYYTLSSAQKRLYFLQQVDLNTTAYNLPQAEILDIEVEKELLEKTFKTLIRRHQALRTYFKMIEGEPVQGIWDRVPFEIQYDDLKANSKSQIPNKLQITNKKEKGIHHSSFINTPNHSFIRPFDLSQAPLMRVGLLKWEGKKHLLIVDMHHIISDGTSNQLLTREFNSLYRGEKLAGLRLQYKDYCQWQKQMAEKPGETLKRQQEYWLKEFAGEIPVLSLPTDYKRPAIQSFAGGMVPFGLGREQLEGLRKIARQEKATMFMVTLSLFYVLAAKVSHQEDIVFGTAVAGRPHADLEKIIGIFVNTLALRNYPAGDKPYKTFLQELREKTIESFDYHDYPFEDLVEKAGVKRDVSRNPLFDIMFAYHDIREESPRTPQEKNIGANPDHTHYTHYQNNTSKFDLTLTVMESKEELQLTLEYCRQLFKEDSINRFIDFFKKITDSVIKDIEIKISAVDLLDEAEKKRVLWDFNDTHRDYPRDKTLHQLFEEQVEMTPDRIALVGCKAEGKKGRRGEGKNACGGIHLTYRELNEQSNPLARVLIEKGVQPDNIVGIKMERSPEMIIGLLGILKAGGAYLPIDPDYPDDRINFMLNDSGAKVLLTAPESQAKVKKESIALIEISRLFSFSTSTLTSTSTCQVSPTNLAYIIYTSGTTGKPKGTLTRHYNVIRVVKNTDYLEITGEDRLLQLSNYAFDGSVFDIYGALLNGAALVQIRKQHIIAIDHLAGMIRKERISVFFITTALFNALVDLKIECFEPVRKVLFGGERVSVEHCGKALRHLGKDRIIHVYGPTETTVYATYYFISEVAEDAVTIPIGKSLSNTTAYILDKMLQLVPIGIPGELFIGGDGVARGYLNNPELTAEKFDHDKKNKSFLGGPGGRFFKKAPLAARGKLYKTGDLVRWLPDGSIEFMGRIDHQVKIRGFRIEMGEIEHQLLKHRHIKQAVVLANETGKGEKELCAYIVSETDFTTFRLRDYLVEVLPDYMVPSAFVKVEKIPMTPNGKVDRRELEAHGTRIGLGVEYVEPASDLEKRIAATWKEILQIDQIGVHDNFFEIGGNSIKIIQLNRKLKEVFQRDIPVVTMFRYPTVSAFSRYLEQEKTSVGLDRDEDRRETLKRAKQDKMQRLQRRKEVNNE